MEWSTLVNLQPSKLAMLLEVDERNRWHGEDPASILSCQLAAPLLPDLLAVRGSDSLQLEDLVAQRPSGETFLQHLLSPQPSLELLLAIKAFARHIGEDIGNPLYGDTAKLIYFSAIAAALARRGSRITSLRDVDLRSGFTWAQTHSCAGDLRILMEPAAAMLKG